MKKRICACTMAYNEIHKLPRWLDHYERQIGNRADLYVIDHGSSDGSTESLGGVNVQRLERDESGAVEQVWRANYVSEFCNNLLKSYDYVVYSDADELVFPALGKGETLLDYVNTAENIRGSAIGFDIIHDTTSEGPLDIGKRIFEQRSKLQLVGAMFKTVLISSPIRWTLGFHCSSHEPSFGDLILAHLRYADLAEGLERLNLTRSLVRVEHAKAGGDHQKISDETFQKWVNGWSKYPTKESSLDLNDEMISEYLNSVSFKQEGGIYNFDYGKRSETLFTPVAALRQAV